MKIELVAILSITIILASFVLTAQAEQSGDNKDQVKILEKGESYVILPAASLPQEFINAVKSYAASQLKINAVYQGQIFWDKEQNPSNIIAIKMDGELEDIMPSLTQLTKDKLPKNSFVDFVGVGENSVIKDSDLSTLMPLYKK